MSNRYLAEESDGSDNLPVSRSNDFPIDTKEKISVTNAKNHVTEKNAEASRTIQVTENMLDKNGSEKVKGSGIQLDTDVDENAFYNGVVYSWKRTWGIIRYKPKEDSDKTSTVFFHKSGVQTNDAKVLLRRGMDVRCQIKYNTDRNSNIAVNITAPDGDKISFLEKNGENDKFDRVMKFESKVFTGTVVFFSIRRGYGRIAVNEDELTDHPEVPMDNMKKCYFKDIDIQCDSLPVQVKKGSNVQFNLFNSSRGWGCTNVKLKDGGDFEIYVPKNTKRTKQSKKSAKSPKKPKRTEIDDSKSYTKIDPDVRYTGVVSYFATFRHGFLKPGKGVKFKEFGAMKQGKLCFRVYDVQSEERPVQVDVGTKVNFSLVRKRNNTLYAVNVTTIDEQNITASAPYEQPKRQLESKDFVYGAVYWFNWSSGHGRIKIDGEEPGRQNLYYFNRSDIVSTDKVPGVETGKKIRCLKVVCKKGKSVTQITTEEGESIHGFLPFSKYMKGGLRKSKEESEQSDD